MIEFQRIDNYFINEGIPELFIAGPGVHLIEIELFGCQGGNDGGIGARVTGSLAVNPGDSLYVSVCAGGGVVPAEFSSTIGNGGGATDIRLSPNDLNSRLAVAGGGGGTYININGRGGLSSGLIGANGNSFNIGGIDATGGTQISGGNIGGSFGFGAPGSANGAGGGGGWYGGGSNVLSGGGGGSCYIGGVDNGTMDFNTENLDPTQAKAIIRSYMLIPNVPCAVGCTDPLALNFDPQAAGDDGSCQYTPGCTYPEAENYNPAALSDDGSCLFPPIGNDCAADITGDGVINTNDLLALLAVFGTVCP
jgi:hypothetical protein